MKWKKKSAGHFKQTEVVKWENFLLNKTSKTLNFTYLSSSKEACL